MTAALRPLLDRGDPLRGAHRAGAVRGRQRRRGGAEAGLGGAAAAERDQPRGAAGARRGRDAGAGEGPRGRASRTPRPSSRRSTRPSGRPRRRGAQDTAAFAAVSPRASTDIPGDEDGVRGGARRRGRWRWILLALLVAGVAALVAYALTRTDRPSVPDVTGQSVDHGRQRARSQGFDVDDQGGPQRRPAEPVLEQDPIPPPARKADEGSTDDPHRQLRARRSSRSRRRGPHRGRGQKTLEDAGFEVNRSDEFSEDGRRRPGDRHRRRRPAPASTAADRDPADLARAEQGRGPGPGRPRTTRPPSRRSADAGSTGDRGPARLDRAAGQGDRPGPAAGKQVARGSQVTIFVSTGSDHRSRTWSARPEGGRERAEAGRLRPRGHEKNTTDPTAGRPW